MLLHFSRHINFACPTTIFIKVCAYILSDAEHRIGLPPDLDNLENPGIQLYGLKTRKTNKKLKKNL